jgi:hypothetical protein
MSNQCELCDEGHAQVIAVEWGKTHPRGQGLAAIACVTRGFGHVVPRTRAEAFHKTRATQNNDALPIDSRVENLK